MNTFVGYLDKAAAARTPAEVALGTARTALQSIGRFASDIDTQDYAVTTLMRLCSDPEPVEVARVSLRRLSATSTDPESRERAARALDKIEAVFPVAANDMGRAA
jgi:hypothetical protein